MAVFLMLFIWLPLGVLCLLSFLAAPIWLLLNIYLGVIGESVPYPWHPFYVFGLAIILMFSGGAIMNFIEYVGGEENKG